MSLSEARQYLANTIADWEGVRLSDLQFWHRGDGRLFVVGLAFLALFVLAARSFLVRQPGRHRLVVPAILTTLRPTYLGFVRHLPLLLFIAGIPLFTIAVADPFSSLVTSEVSYPGRRIALMIDASTSMRTPFKASHLNARAETDATFFTTVAAADRFVKMRMGERYRDLMALIEFGNEAYVVTPFTNDYDNILLSISLIGDPVEYSLFPDQGTIIAQAINQSIGLFRAFNFMDVLRRRGHARPGRRQDSRRDPAGLNQQQDPRLHGSHQLRTRAGQGHSGRNLDSGHREDRRTLLRGEQRGRAPRRDC